MSAGASWRIHAIEAPRKIRRLMVDELKVAGARRRFHGGAHADWIVETLQ
jgi:hypothetical protein